MFWPIIVILILVIPILSIVLDSHVGRALAARLERRGLSDTSDLIAQRLAFLEGEVDRLGSKTSRLEEESQFLHKLLTERTGASAPRALAEGEDGG